MSKSVFIETYGCQMNAYDTELIRSILKKENFTFSEQETEADIVMLNTCSVRDNANRKVYNRIHEIRHARHGAPVMIGVLGCMATNFRQALLDNPKLGIDFIAGPDSYKQLPHLIEEVSGTGKKQFDVTLSEFETYSDVLPTRLDGVNAWIAVMRGCNNFCSFCVVPFTRGRERSRDPENVVEEVRKLVAQGFSQVTLLGQNVNSYRSGDNDFADLMARVSDVPGIRRIRFTSPHPKDFPTKFLNVMKERDNICKQIHLPLQAGSTRVLDKMNRTYTKEEFLDLVAHIRDLMPDIALSTDVIVGFPTETDAEFEDTLDVMERVQFDSAFMFKYSERELTLASRRFPDDVPEAIKTERIVRLNELQKRHCLAKNSAYIGKELEVLIEADTTKKAAKKGVAEIQGRTDSNKLVILPGEAGFAVGAYEKVRITEATPNVLRGVPLC
ncbi:MAG: tRNA (N6-isopentenyl adenosine(37)-C2)-methylthiotransferase MiaB [Candidatus Margulisiibacteriota bacterium]